MTHIMINGAGVVSVDGEDIVYTSVELNALRKIKNQRDMKRGVNRKMENILTNEESDQVRYVVKVSGNEVSPRYPTQQAAEAALQLLKEEHQSIAEIVPVTDNGQLLLG